MCVVSRARVALAARHCANTRHCPADDNNPTRSQVHVAATAGVPDARSPSPSQEYAMKRIEDGQHRWRSLRRLLFAAAIAATCAGNAPAQLVIRQYTMSGTGVSASRNSCYALSSTASEAVAGPSNAGQYQLVSGFWGTRPTAARHNSIFSNGFEDCSP